MGATSLTGLGIGSVEKLKPLIINGVVKAENLGVDILHNWKYDINATGDMTTESNVSADGDISSGGDVSADGDISSGNDINADGNISSGNDINADGNISSDNDINAGNNITADGYIRGDANGQHLNTSFYTFTDGELSNGNNNNYVDFASVSYTPVSGSSSLYIEYNATYAVGGGLADTFRSRITVNDVEITWRNQTWTNSAGGGTRSAVLFPITMVFSNSVTTALIIKIQAKRDGADDILTLNTNSAILKVSEYAR
jgi:hypothetical protein